MAFFHDDRLRLPMEHFSSCDGSRGPRAGHPEVTALFRTRHVLEDESLFGRSNIISDDARLDRFSPRWNAERDPRLPIWDPRQLDRAPPMAHRFLDGPIGTLASRFPEDSLNGRLSLDRDMEERRGFGFQQSEIRFDPERGIRHPHAPERTGSAGCVTEAWGPAHMPERAASQRSGEPISGKESSCPLLAPPKWEDERLVNFTKNLYVVSEKTQQRSHSENEKFRRAHHLQVFGAHVPAPCLSVEELSCLPEPICQLLQAESKEMTPAEAQLWPIVMSGRDVLCTGVTGVPRVLSYVLPAVMHINAQPRLQTGEGAIVLVLCPTREGAVLVQDVCTKYGHSSGVKNAIVIGGVPKGPQIRDVQKGIEILIATPIRLAELIASGATTLSRVTFVVLEDVDLVPEFRMTDHFLQLMKCVRPGRQVLVFANTLSSYVKDFCSTWCEDRVELHAAHPQRIADVPQSFERVSDELMKRQLLCPLLDKLLDRSQCGLILLRSLERASELTADLRSNGYPALMVDGTPERTWVISEVASGKASILLSSYSVLQTTELASLTFHKMVQFDAPDDAEEYLSRLWLLVRPDYTGESVSFVTPDDQAVVNEVSAVLRGMESKKSGCRAVSTIVGNGHSVSIVRPSSSVAICGAYGRGVGRSEMESIDDDPAESQLSGSVSSPKRRKIEDGVSRPNSLGRSSGRQSSQGSYRERGLRQSPPVKHRRLR
eukprot:RCo033770